MDLQHLPIEISGEALILHPYRCVYWPARDMVWISDLHLGKASHFQKSGIPIPERISDENWSRLYHVLDYFHPKDVVFMGDLFHSEENKDWDILGRFTKAFGQINYHLVKGNHDILDSEAYQRNEIIIHQDLLEISPFIFSHHPLEAVPDCWYNICGHIHPAVRLRGMARQGLKIPCFYFNEIQGILPAFGAFTGTAVIRPDKKDFIYLIVEDQIVPV